MCLPVQGGGGGYLCHVFTLSTSVTPGVQGLKYRRCSINGDCHAQIQRFHIPSLTSSVLVKKMPAVSLAPRAPGLNFAALTFQGGRSHGTWRISRSHLFSSPCATNSNLLLVRKDWWGSESPQSALQSHLLVRSGLAGTQESSCGVRPAEPADQPHRCPAVWPRTYYLIFLSAGAVGCKMYVATVPSLSNSCER